MRGSKNEESRQWTGGSRPRRQRAPLFYFLDFVRLDIPDDLVSLVLATVASFPLPDFVDFAVPPPRSALR